MLQAVGSENKVNRIHAFNSIKSTDFHSKPMEMIFADVDSKIDQALGNSTEFYTDNEGRMISIYSFSTYHKYAMILEIIEKLEGEFCQVKGHIEQKIYKMFDDCKTLRDIPTFQTELVTEFNKRNLIKIFRTKDIPNQKNKPNVNNSDVSEKKTDKKNDKKKESTSLKEEFKKKKLEISKDLEISKEMITSFIPKIEESNKNTPLGKVPEISAILKEKNQRACYGCMSSNCQLMQHLCYIHKTQKKFLGKCTGKQLTM